MSQPGKVQGRAPGLPLVRKYPASRWAAKSAALIQETMEFFLEQKGFCHVMLTGGRSGERLYHEWALCERLGKVRGVSFYFGDERCVPPDHPESNYGLVMRSLFRLGVPERCSVLRMEGEDPDREEAARRYERLLPERIDLLLLGVGEDGHIASLFPGSDALREHERRVLAVRGAKPPHQRLTITKPVIEEAARVFILASGQGKGEVLVEALRDPLDVDALPARLALHGEWLLELPTQEQK